MAHQHGAESAWAVTVTATQVACRRPDGAVETVRWDDLRAVYIETTDEGPLAPDVFWVLVGEAGGCTVPQGATGEGALLRALQALEGFDHEALIGAMSSAENRRFLCWRRP